MKNKKRKVQNFMELIKIVDEQGNFTGTIMDKEKAHNLNLFYWAVGIFVINNKKQVLLQKRGANKKIKPNMWAMCAGHVKVDEQFEIAAVRELNEEIGLKVSQNDLHLLESMEIQKTDKNSHLTRFYYVISNKDEDEFTIQEEELSEVKWFNIDDVIEMIKCKDESIVFKENRIHLFEKIKEECDKANLKNIE